MAKGYQSYRGRRSKGRTALIAALALILLGACAFLFIQRYVVYTDDGQWHFQWPVPGAAGRDGPPSGGDGGPDVNLVVDGPQQGGGPDEPRRPYGQRRLIGLDALPSDAQALEEALARSGANGFVYTVRDDTGRVFYDSAVSQEQAAQRDVGMEALSALCAGEDTLAVARFNCFHDSYYASVHMADAGICRASGDIWSDERSYYWLDAGKEPARRYVIDLALECARMGFDELLLEELAFPSTGNLSRIDYSGETMGKSEALALFLTELREALSDYDVKLSLLVTERLLQTGADEASGQDLAVLLPLVDAVYAPVSDVDEARALLERYAGEGRSPALVPITAEAGEGDWCLTAE